MEIKILHQHSLENAREKIQTLLEKKKKQYKNEITNIKEVWIQDTLHAQFSYNSFFISATVKFEVQQIKVDFGLPFLLKIFSGQIKCSVTKELNEALL